MWEYLKDWQWQRTREASDVIHSCLNESGLIELLKSKDFSDDDVWNFPVYVSSDSVCSKRFNNYKNHLYRVYITNNDSNSQSR